MHLPREIQSLLTKSERELVQESFQARQSHGGDSWLELKMRVRLMRKFRDKYRDLAQRQKIEAKRRFHDFSGFLSGGRSLPEKKANVFEAALRRYEERLEGMHEAELGGVKGQSSPTEAA